MENFEKTTCCIEYTKKVYFYNKLVETAFFLKKSSNFDNLFSYHTLVIDEISIFSSYCQNFAYLLFYASSMHVRSFKFINHSESQKTMVEKKVEKEVKYGISYATQKLNYISHHSKKIIFTTSIKKFCTIEGSFTLHLAKFRGNPVPEIKSYNDRHMAFSHKYTSILWQNYTL